MSASPPRLNRRKRSRDQLSRAIILSGVLSVITHGALLLLVATSLRSCNQLPIGTTNETGDIGIVVKEEGPSTSSEAAEEQNSGDQTSESANESSQNTLTQATPDQPPVEPTLPKEESSATVGPGTNVPLNIAATDPREPVKSDGRPHSGRNALPGGTPGAAFMGVRDEGTKVVFVIDASGSMSAHNSMQVAKSSLISSLQALEETQQFLIIFYDNNPVVLNLKGDTQSRLYTANESNKNMARQKLSAIHPGSGTKHVPALEMALRLQPDVIFFLTDAQEPPIYPAELEDLKRMNTKKTRIHAIEFGVGPEIGETTYPSNFLRKLSRQNGGSYRYFDVTKFKN